MSWKVNGGGAFWGELSVFVIESILGILGYQLSAFSYQLKHWVSRFLVLAGS